MQAMGLLGTTYLDKFTWNNYFQRHLLAFFILTGVQLVICLDAGLGSVARKPINDNCRGGFHLAR